MGDRPCFTLLQWIPAVGEGSGGGEEGKGGGRGERRRKRRGRGRHRRGFGTGNRPNRFHSHPTGSTQLMTPANCQGGRGTEFSRCPAGRGAWTSPLHRGASPSNVHPQLRFRWRMLKLLSAEVLPAQHSPPPAFPLEASRPEPLGKSKTHGVWGGRR